MGLLTHYQLNWRSHKLAVSKALSTNPTTCLREGSGGWHYSTTALWLEATAVLERERKSWENPLENKALGEEDNTRKLTPCVWSTVSLTSTWMSMDQVVETMLMSVTWIQALRFSLFSQWVPEKNLCFPWKVKSTVSSSAQSHGFMFLASCFVSKTPSQLRVV